MISFPILSKVILDKTWVVVGVAEDSDIQVICYPMINVSIIFVIDLIVFGYWYTFSSHTELSTKSWEFPIFHLFLFSSKTLPRVGVVFNDHKIQTTLQDVPKNLKF